MTLKRAMEKKSCAIFRDACIHLLQRGVGWGGGLMHEELFQVYYSNCILPLPEDLALKQDNNKGFAVFQHKVHVPEVAPAPESEHNSRDI